LLEVRRTLNAFDLAKSGDAITALDSSVKSFLMSSCDAFPLDDVEKLVTNQVRSKSVVCRPLLIKQILTQIYSTLHDYSCINQLLTSLLGYIKQTVRLAWKLSNQMSPYTLDGDFTLSTINHKKHVRSAISNHKSNIIQYFLWPALLQNGEILSKAVVVT